MMAHPEMVAGTNCSTPEVMRAGKGTVVVKGGARKATMASASCRRRDWVVGDQRWKTATEGAGGTPSSVEALRQLGAL